MKDLLYRGIFGEGKGADAKFPKTTMPFTNLISNPMPKMAHSKAYFSYFLVQIFTFNKQIVIEKSLKKTNEEKEEDII
jgi:hypothetical protein